MGKKCIQQYIEVVSLKISGEFGKNLKIKLALEMGGLYEYAGIKVLTVVKLKKNSACVQIKYLFKI